MRKLLVAMTMLIAGLVAVDIGTVNGADAALVPLVPQRIIDTRPDEPGPGPKGRVSGGQEVEVMVAGSHGVPESASAVFLNVTAVRPDGPGYLTVYPCGVGLPQTSNVNYNGGDVSPNSVLVGIGAGGKICVYTSTSSDVLVDVAGYVPADGEVSPVVPDRLLDTRYDGPGRVAAGHHVEVVAAGSHGVPESASAVFLNVTAVGPDGLGFLTVYPCGTNRPVASNVNYSGGGITPNLVFATIGDGGRVCIYTSAETDVLVDLVGYAPADGAVTPLEPARILDSRPGQPTVDGRDTGLGRQAAGSRVQVAVAGRAGVPTSASAVFLNVTAVSPDGPGFLTVYPGPCDSDPPVASNVNYNGGDVRPNSVLAALADDGTICIYTLQTSDVIVDVAGYVLEAAKPPSLGETTTIPPAPTTTTTIVTQPPDGNDPKFSSCKEANENGYGNYVRGQDPEYSWYQDRDKDGIVCEF